LFFPHRPPKKKGGGGGKKNKPSGKQIDKAKKKIVEDKTFGLKNKVSKKKGEKKKLFVKAVRHSFRLLGEIQKGPAICAASEDSDGHQGER
jgi:hypothetical protein